MSVDLAFLRQLKSNQHSLSLIAKVMEKVMQRTPPGAGEDLSEFLQIVLNALLYERNYNDNYDGQNVCEYLLEVMCTDD